MLVTLIMSMKTEKWITDYFFGVLDDKLEPFLCPFVHPNPLVMGGVLNGGVHQDT